MEYLEVTAAVTAEEREMMKDYPDMNGMTVEQLQADYIKAVELEIAENEFHDEDHEMHVDYQYRHYTALRGQLKLRKAWSVLATLPGQRDAMFVLAQEKREFERRHVEQARKAEVTARRRATREAHKLGFTWAGVEPGSLGLYALGESRKVRY